MSDYWSQEKKHVSTILYRAITILQEIYLVERFSLQYIILHKYMYIYSTNKMHLYL